MATSTGIGGGVTSGSDIAAYAQRFLGDPYVWGAVGPNKFDCSGLVDYVYQHFGLNPPRTTEDMLAGKGGLQAIQKKDLQPGDLILSKGWVSSEPNQGHVGIYMGGGKLIEAGDPVQVSTFGPTYEAHVTGYRRVPGVTGYAGTGTPPAPGGSGYTGGLPNPLNPGQVAGFLGAWIPNPSTVTEGLANIGNAAGNIAGGAISVGTFAQNATKIFLPTNMLRMALLFMGFVFVLIGVWFIASEAKG